PRVSLRTRSKTPPKSTPSRSNLTMTGGSGCLALPSISCPVLHPRQQQERRPRQEERRGTVGGVAHPLGRYSRKCPGEGASQTEQRAQESVLCGRVGLRAEDRKSVV